MNPRFLATLAAALGGALWIVRWVVGGPADDRSPADVLHWLGLVLLALGLAAVGAGLVSRSAVALRALVAVAFPLLVWSVVEVVRPGDDAHVFDGVVGLLALAAAAVLLVRARRRGDGEPASRPRRGSHAA